MPLYCYLLAFLFSLEDNHISEDIYKMKFNKNDGNKREKSFSLIIQQESYMLVELPTSSRSLNM